MKQIVFLILVHFCKNSLNIHSFYPFRTCVFVTYQGMVHYKFSSNVYVSIESQIKAEKNSNVPNLTLFDSWAEDQIRVGEYYRQARNSSNQRCSFEFRKKALLAFNRI